jgi:hypothetical protein
MAITHCIAQSITRDGKLYKAGSVLPKFRLLLGPSLTIYLVSILLLLHLLISNIKSQRIYQIVLEITRETQEKETEFLYILPRLFDPMAILFSNTTSPK